MFDANVLVIPELARIGAITLLYFLSILGWGHLGRRCFSLPEGDFTDYISQRLVLGCFGLYAAFILLGAGGVLNGATVSAVLATGLLFGLLQIPAAAKNARHALSQVSQWSIQQQILFAIVCALAALQIACAFVPLVFYDAQVYQLAAPVQFLKTGGFAHIPLNVYSNSPLALQLTFGMSWLFDSTGNTFKVLIGLFGCLVLPAAAKIARPLGIWPSLIAALFVVSYPEFWIQQTLGVVDLPIAAFLLFGVIWWQESLRHRSWTSLLLGGIAMGLAVASRYQAVVLTAWTLLALFAAESFRSPASFRRNLAKAGAIVVVIGLITAPWLIRNYSHTGNPVYPLLYRWLGGDEWSTDQAIQLQREVIGRSLLEVSGAEMAMAPFAALMVAPSNGLFGPILLLGVLLAVIGGAGEIRIYAGLGLGGLILWGLIHPAMGVPLLRFNSASLVLLLTCTGAMLACDRLRELKGIHVAGVLAVGSLIIAFAALQGLVPAWQSLISSRARVSFWRANVPSWRAMEFANGHIDPAQHKVLLIGETRGLWLNIPYIAPSPFNGPQLAEMFASPDPEEWSDKLRRLGITHLLINTPEWERLRERRAYFLLPDKNIDSFNRWLHSLPIVFNDDQGTVVLPLQAKAR